MLRRKVVYHGANTTTFGAVASSVLVQPRSFNSGSLPLSARNSEAVQSPRVLQMGQAVPAAFSLSYILEMISKNFPFTSKLGANSGGRSFVLWRKADGPSPSRLLSGPFSRCAKPDGEKKDKSDSAEKSGDEKGEAKSNPNDGLIRGIFNSSKPGDKEDKKGGGGNEDEDDDEGGTKPPARGGDQVLKHYFFGTAFLLALTLGFYWLASPSGPNVTWEEAASWSDKIRKVQLYEHFVQFELDTGDVAHIGLTGSTQRTDMLMKTLTKLGAEVPVVYVGSTYSEGVLSALGTVLWLLPILFFPVYSLGMARLVGSAGGQQQGAQSSKFNKKMFSITKRTDTRFKDIAGMHEAKSEVREVVDFLKHPEPYAKLGAKIPTGALLLGPPGTGKTLLAKAVAGEAGVSFIPTNGSDFVELYVGMGALRVRQLFELAKKQEGRVIIYIDELDAIGLKRRGAGHGEKQEQEHTLNELLTQLDGFHTEENKVLVLASSNVGQDALDPALIRAGRFDRIIHVDAPVLAERREIFGVHLDKLKLIEPPVAELPEFEVVTDGPLKTTGLPKDVEEKVKGELQDLVREKGGTVGSVKVIEVKDINDEAEVATALKKAQDGEKAVFAAEKEEAAAAEKLKSASVDEEAKLKEEPATESATAKFAEAKLDGAKMDDATATEILAEKALHDKPTSENSDKTPQQIFEAEKAVLVADFAARMSDLCPGFVGADISNICNEAAILAARQNDDLVTIDHLEKSIDRVLAGIEMRSRVLSDFEKKVVAHHEAGHAIAGWYLNRADPLMKVSIVPRGGKALGYAQYLPSENNLRSGKDIIDSMCVALGGRVAEMVYFGHLSTGASDDLLKVTRMAYMHVSAFNETGMSHTPPSRAPYRKQYGDSIGDKLDVAAMALVDQAYQRTFELLTARKEEMTKLADHLMKHEVLTQDDVVAYLGDREKRGTDFHVA